MNCSACGGLGGAMGPGPSPLVCGACLGTGASSTSPGSSAAASHPGAPLRGRRCHLRRAGARKGPDQFPPGVTASFEAEVRRKMDVAVHAAAVARSARRIPVDRDPLPRDLECHFDHQVEDLPVEPEIRSVETRSVETRAVEPHLRPEESDPDIHVEREEREECFDERVDLDLDANGDEDADADADAEADAHVGLDTDADAGADADEDAEAEADTDADADVDGDGGSMEVSAAQSETASTVSRAAFSVSDRTELEGRDGGAILSGISSRDDRGNTQRKNRVNDNVKAQLRAAYVRELLLSSLSL